MQKNSPKSGLWKSRSPKSSLVLNQSPVSAVFWIVRFAGNPNTALTGDPLYISMKPRPFSGYLAHHRTTVRCKFHLSANLSINPNNTVQQSILLSCAVVCRKMKFQSHHLTMKKTRWTRLFEGQWEALGGIQQLRGQNFATFWPSTCVDSFYTLSVDKNRHFLTPSLHPYLVHVVIEWPLTRPYWFANR